MLVGSNLKFCNATNLLTGIKKQRHYFASKVSIVKALVFPVVMYGCEIWAIKKAEC